jgi:purine-binding chemotaxis protein CheW
VAQASPRGKTAAEPAGAQVVVFQVAGKLFAADLARVEQVIEYREPTRTPRRPPHVEGVVEHQGRYVALVSLRKRFGLREEGPARPAVLLLANVGSDPVVGLVVDQVLRVLALPSDGVLSPPPRVFGIRAEYMRGVANMGGRPIVWLDITKLLAATESITLLT